LEKSLYCCGEVLVKEVPMKKYDVRICEKCGNIRDLSAARKYDAEFVDFQISGRDPKGKFNSRLGVWVSS